MKLPGPCRYRKLCDRQFFLPHLLAHRGHALHARLAVHQVAHMKHEVRRRAGYAVNVRNRVEQAAQLRMVGDISLNVFQPLAGGLQAWRSRGFPLTSQIEMLPLPEHATFDLHKVLQHSRTNAAD